MDKYSRATKALEQLVYTKDYKALYGKDEIYEKMRTIGWKLAREVLVEKSVLCKVGKA